MTEENNSEKKEPLIEAAKKHLSQGESYVLIKQSDGEVEVGPTSVYKITSPLKESHPDLFAQLLKINKQIEDRGGSWRIGFYVLGIVFFALMNLNLHGGSIILSLIFLVEAVVVSISLAIFFHSLTGQFTYWRLRKKVHHIIKDHRMTLSEVINLTLEVEKLSEIHKRLLLDKIEIERKSR